MRCDDLIQFKLIESVTLLPGASREQQVTTFVDTFFTADATTHFQLLMD